MIENIQINMDSHNERPLKGLRGLVAGAFIEDNTVEISESETTRFSAIYLANMGVPILKYDDPQMEAWRRMETIPPLLIIKIGKNIVGELHEQAMLKRNSDFKIDIITWSCSTEVGKTNRNNYFDAIKKIINQFAKDHKNDNLVNAKKP